MRIKVMINEPETDDMREVILENDEAARILTSVLNAGARLTLAAGQKLYRIEAVPRDTGTPVNTKKDSIKAGDSVRYKDGDDRIYTVYAVYSDSMISLGLADYPDTEQDGQININKIIKV